MIRIRIGNKYIKYVDDERLEFTEDVNEAGVYTEGGALLIHEIVKKHLGAKETTH